MEHLFDNIYKEKTSYQCNHQIEDSPFCIKCNCIYHPLTNTSSIKKIYAPIVLGLSVNDIFCNMKHTEYDINYEQPLPVIEARISLIEKIKRTIAKLNFHKSTYYLTIYLMDVIFLEETKEKVFMRNEQIALGCTFLSIKFNERDTLVPTLKEIQNCFEPKVYYSIEQLRKIEVFCLKKLNYTIRYFTPYDYIDFFNKIGISFSIEDFSMKIQKDSLDVLENIMKKTNEYLLYNSHLLAVSMRSVARKNNNKDKKIFNQMIKYAYNINQEDLEAPLQFIMKLSRVPSSLSLLKEFTKEKRTSSSLTRMKQNTYKNYNRSSSTSTSSGEVSMNLQKIKEQSKLIKRNLYSLNSNLLNTDKEKSNLYKSDLYKFRINQLKVSLNNSIYNNYNSGKKTNLNDILFHKEIKQDSYSQRELSQIFNPISSRMKNHVNRNIKRSNISNSKSVMLSFDKLNSFLDSNKLICNSHRKLLSNSMMTNSDLKARSKGVLGPNKF